MDDLISRQAAIDAVDGVDWYHQNKDGEMVYGANSDEHQAWYKADDIYTAIESVSSATQSNTSNTLSALDVIDRAAVWDALNGIEISRNASWYEFYQKALTAVGELPPAQPGWIPCNIALPEHDGEYLVTKKSFGWNCNEYTETDIARYEKKNGWHKADTVLAWCELPKPWEGGQNNGID